MDYVNKRRHPRLPVLVECRLDGASGRHEMRMTDLSPTGCFVDTSMSFPEGTQVTLYAQLGGGEVVLPGRVVPIKTGGFGFGIEFVDLDEGAKKQLDAYIQQAGS
ncbi:MAG: PilZ domain-containing protein [Vicinamibacterales bacterium]